jgi:hypothetical protein
MDLSDAQWELVQPMLPPAKATGRPRANDRRTINGILYVLCSRVPLEAFTEQCGSPVTCWPRLDQWQIDSTEVKLAEATPVTVKVPRLCGRPRTRPKELVTDKGYNSRPLRRRLRSRGIKPCIPERRGKRPRLGRKADPLDIARGGRWTDLCLVGQLPQVGGPI